MKNTLAQVVRFGAIAVSKFLIVVVIARWSGVEQVGDFSFVMTFSMAFAFLNDLGLSLLLTRAVAQDRDQQQTLLGNALMLSLVLGPLSVLVMGGTARLLGYSGQIVTAVVLVAVAMMIEALGNLFVSVFNGHERMELGTLTIVIQEFAFLIVGAVILILNLPFLWVFVIFILSRLVGFVASAQIYWRIWGRPPLLINPTVMRELVRETLPFAVNLALSPIFARVDILLLSYFQGNVAVGYYEVSSTLFYRLNVLARMFNLALMPLVAREYTQVGARVVGYVRRAVQFQAAAAVPLTVLCWVLGGHLVVFIYGSEFIPSVLPFQIMASVTLLRFLDNTLGLTLTAINLQGRRALATAVMAVFNIVANIVVLPRYSFLGAAITSVATEIGYFVLLYIFVRSRLPNPITPGVVLRPLLASAVMALPLLLLQDWSLLLLLPIGLAVYGAGAVILRVITPEEMGYMLRAGHVWRFVPPRVQRWLSPPAVVSKVDG